LRSGGGFRSSALRVSASYVGLGFLWLGLINKIPLLFVQMASLQRIRIFEHVIFVLLSGSLIYMVVCREMHRRLRVHEELMTTKQTLESLINLTTDAIAIDDLQGIVMEVNPAYESLYGWVREEVVGKPIAVIPDSHRSEYEVVFRRVVAGGRVTDYETVRKHKDGSLMDISITMSPIRDRHGNIIAIASIARDIRERKRTEEVLRKSDKLSVAAQMAAGVAHEIRNPLTTVKGFVQLLERKYSSEEPYFEIILSETKRIEDIIREFLLVAKPQAIELKPWNVGDILRSVQVVLAPQTNFDHVEIVLDVAEDLPQVLGVEDQLKQVFINISKNAMESMPAGGRVYIKATRFRSQEVRISFRDEGNGIQEDQIRRLGEPYYTTKDRGTGLGLMVSFKIIENHHGYIRIDSVVGEGTTVEVTLPAWQTPRNDHF